MRNDIKNFNNIGMVQLIAWIIQGRFFNCVDCIRSNARWSEINWKRCSFFLDFDVVWTRRYESTLRQNPEEEQHHHHPHRCDTIKSHIKMYTEAVVTSFKMSLRYFPGGNTGNYEKHSAGYPVNLIPLPPEYETRVLPTKPPRSISTRWLRSNLFLRKLKDMERRR
jgi:hypothetical protein